jgi:hypothetical protein
VSFSSFFLEELDCFYGLLSNSTRELFEPVEVQLALEELEVALAFP